LCEKESFLRREKYLPFPEDNDEYKIYVGYEIEKSVESKDHEV